MSRDLRSVALRALRARRALRAAQMAEAVELIWSHRSRPERDALLRGLSAPEILAALAAEPAPASRPLPPLAAESWRLDEEAALELQQACDLFSRLQMGQLDTLALDAWGDLSTPLMVRCRRSIEAAALAPLVTGSASPGAYLGIYAGELPEAARDCWDIHQVLRHHRAWRDEPQGGWQTHFDPPRRAGRHSLPQIAAAAAEAATP